MLTADDIRSNPQVRIGFNTIVVCLCAEWCGTCRVYREEFSHLAQKYPEHTFIWLDIEDDTDLVGDIDIETFPTLLIARNADILFGGVLLPHIQHLDRLLGTLDDRKPLQKHELLNVVKRLRGN